MLIWQYCSLQFKINRKEDYGELLSLSACVVIFCQNFLKEIGEMKSFTMNLVFAVVVVLSLFAPTFGAVLGGMGEPSMGDSMNLQDINASWSWNNYNDNGNGSFWLRLENHSLASASWDIRVLPEDTSQFRATLSASGFLLDGESLYFGRERSQNTNLNRRGVSIYDSLYVNYEKAKTDEQGLVLSKDAVYLNGSFNLRPAYLTNASFNYNEYTPHWEDSLEKTFWYASYQFAGQFIAPTLAEAQFMGAQFAQTVPEPATITMFATFCLALGGYCLRRHKR